MTLRLALVIASLAGCDQVFGLERPDAPPPACSELTTHDEDGDGVVDTCDSCPGIGNPLQEDVRETEAGALPDGVGDACDPRPTVSGDHVERFLAFTEPSSISDWESFGGTWTIDGEHLVFDEQTIDTPQYLRNLGSPLVPPVTIETHLRIVAIPEERVYIGSVANADLTGDGSSCSLFRPFETPVRKDAAKLFHPMGQTEALLARQIAPGDGYRLTFTVGLATTLRCSIRNDDGSVVAVSAPLDEPLPAGGLGFLAQRSKVEFDYVIVYGISAAAR